MQRKIRKVVIPVAGLGTRGLPFTKDVPKEMLPIIDTPTIHYIVEEALLVGIEQVVFITSKGKSTLEDYFDLSPNLENWLRKRNKEALLERISKIGRMCEVISVRQKEPLGLGHAIHCAHSIIGNEMFAVCLGDEMFPPWEPINEARPALGRLVDSAERLGKSVVGVIEVEKSEVSSYGIIDIGSTRLENDPVSVSRTVEKPKLADAPSQYALIGRYVFEPELMDLLKDAKPGLGGEIQLTDAMDKLCKQGRLFAQKLQGARYDIGSHYSYIRAQIDEGLRRPELRERLLTYVRSL